MEYKIIARGHENIRATHNTTWEITTETELTPAGDCIIGVSASHGAMELPIKLKNHLKNENWIRIELRHGERIIMNGKAKGSRMMSISHPTDIVFRKSDYVDNRTCGINCSFASKDLPRDFIKKLRKCDTEFIISIHTVNGIDI